MPECTSCGATEFQSINGEFYCTTCQTLSQIHGICAEINEDEVYQTITRGARINLKKQATEGAIEENPKNVLGRPWKSHEGFQHILRGQVDALIKLGVDAKLEGIVFKLWMLFLQKCGIAFLSQKPSPEKAQFQRLRQRVRDKYLGTMENPRVKAVRTIIAMRKRASWLEKHQKDENDETEDVVDEEEFYEGDDPNEKPLDDIDVLLEAEKRDRELRSRLVADEVIHTDKGVPVLKKNERKEIPRPIEEEKCKISLCKIISLVYIGLQYTNNRVLPHDLVRWIKQSKLPYNRAQFPNDMKFFASDYQTFCCPPIPAPNKIVWEAAKLVSFLELKSLPVVNITCIVHRFIIELGLPGELHTLVSNLIQVQPPSMRVRKVHGASGSIDFACMAMAYIVITLKMIFGLDDASEWKLTKYAQILSSFIEFDPPLFIWSDWVAHAEKQMLKERGKWFPDDIKDMQNIENVETVFAHFDSQKGKLTQYSTSSGYYSAYKEETRRLISDGLTDIYESSKFAERRKNRTSESSDSVRDPLEESVLVENERQLFQDATLQYILEPDNFLSSIGSGDDRVADETDSNFYDPQSLCNDDSDSEFNPSFDMFGAQRHKRKSCRNESFAGKRKRIRLKTPGTSMQEIRDNLPFAPHDFPKPFKNYALFEIPSIKAKFTRSEPCLETYPPRIAKRYQSYDWLLEVCSSHISENVTTLEEYVQRLELVLVADSKEFGPSEDTKKILFLSKCFSKARVRKK